MGTQGTASTEASPSSCRSLRSAAWRVLSALRARKASSALEEVVFQRTWRLLHCEEEKQVNLKFDDEQFSPISKLLYKKLDFDFKSASARHLLTPSRLWELIDMLRRAELPDFEEVMVVLDAVLQDLDKLPNVVSVNVPKGGHFVIVGDLHGQLSDFNRVLDLGGGSCGGPSSTTPFLFNGDFVDRGKHGLEVILTLFCYRLLMPDALHLNRGNHECERTCRHYGFYNEVQTKYTQGGSILFDQIQKVFMRLPLVHVVSERIAIVHGGLPPDLGITLEEIQAINRKAPVPGGDPNILSRPDRIFQSLLWSDPEDLQCGSDWKHSPRYAGVLFGEGVLARFLAANDLDLLIRSHDVSNAGYATHHDGKTITVFSASNYANSDNNKASYLKVHPSLRVEFCQYSVLADDFKKMEKVKASELHDEAWIKNAKHECLSLLRCMIFAKRKELLHKFREKDEGLTGTVSVGDWISVCKFCLHEKVPWYAMRKYLVICEEDGSIAYIPFLERFQNELARRWMTRWSEKMLPFIAPILLDCVYEEQGCISYLRLCDALRRELPGLRELFVYYILVTLCPGGRVDTEALKSAAEDAPHVAVCVAELWVINNFHPKVWRSLQGRWQVAVRDLAGLTPAAFAAIGMDLCKQTGQAAYLRWQGAGMSIASKETGLVEWSVVLKMVQDFNREWTSAAQICDIISTTARVCVDLTALFQTYDDDNSGFLTFEQFHTAVGHLVGQRIRKKEEIEQMFAVLDLDGSGKIGNDEFVQSLEVVDTWNPEVSIQPRISRRSSMSQCMMSKFDLVRRLSVTY